MSVQFLKVPVPATCARPYQCRCIEVLLALIALAFWGLLAIAMWPYSFAETMRKEPLDVRSFCAAYRNTSSNLQTYSLPDVVSVNWGQWHGPYSLPPERLVICADGRGFLWKQREQLQEDSKPMQELQKSEIGRLFQVILAEWPQGDLERKGESGNFIWLLDADWNFIVAPVMQRRVPDGAIEEIKHGDLSPGRSFFGDNAAAGPYRGVARFGGEFNLAGLRDGHEWIMHAKSGYTAYRVPVDRARNYHDEMHRNGKNEQEIARNFQRCVIRDIFRGRAPLARLLCFLRRQLGVDVLPGATQQCDIRTKLVDGLPNLGECVPKDMGDSSKCDGEADVREDAPIVHLVDWYSPGQDRCKTTVSEFEAMLHSIADNIQTFKAFHPSVASSSGARAYAKSISKKIRSLRKDPCLYSEEFTQQLQCNVHGCFGEGLAQELKHVESSFGGVLQNGAEFESLWSKVMRMWSQCTPRSLGDEL